MLKRLVLAALTLCTTSATAMQDIDPKLPEYEVRSDGIAGTLKSIGSDTILNLMTNWAEVFREFYPAVQVQVEGKGSSTAPPALLDNQAQFGPMSRAMESDETAEFRAKFGYEPTALRAAIDCIAIFVNKDCPIETISLEQLEEAFSVAGEQLTWGDLGATDPAWASHPLSLYGRNSASGTYKFFKKVALNRNDYKESVKEQPGSAGVVNAISSDPYGIGYSGVGFRTPDVKILRVSEYTDEESFAPDPEAANSGDYPLARFLYVYMNHDPRTPLDSLRAEFVRMIFSKKGQEAVIRDGAYPISAEVATEELVKVGLATDG
ncbi:MAG: phosphate transport system substrate-binding protein [Phycisphaerales bacterium]|jgi:phosphate transport system substrate-binding protein